MTDAGRSGVVADRPPPTGWRLAVAKWTSGAGPFPRSGIGLWPWPLVAWAILVAPMAPAVDVVKARTVAGAPVYLFGPADPIVSESSWWIAGTVLVLGVAFASSGRLWDRLRRARGERRARDRGATWWRDRDWDPSHAQQAFSSRSPLAIWWILLLVIALCWTFVWLAHFRTRRGKTWDLPPAVPPCAAVFTLVEVAVLRRRTKRRLSVVVSWPELPQFTGGRVAFHVGTSEPSGPRIVDAKLVLRCLRERPAGPFGLFRRAEVAWRAEYVVAPDLYIGPGAEIRASFDVPADAPSTDLHAREATLWELVVLGRTPIGTVRRAGVCEPVLVPVYRREIETIATSQP